MPGMAVTRSAEIARSHSGFAVVGAEILNDRLGVFGADRSAEDLDHLGHAAVPAIAVEKRRIHDDIVETVAGAAVRLDLRSSGRILQFESPFLREHDAGSHDESQQQLS